MRKCRYGYISVDVCRGDMEGEGGWGEAMDGVFIRDSGGGAFW